MNIPRRKPIRNGAPGAETPAQLALSTRLSQRRFVILKGRSAATVLDQFLDPLSRCLDAESARSILALNVSASVQERVDMLAERANEFAQ